MKSQNPKSGLVVVAVVATVIAFAIGGIALTNPPVSPGVSLLREPSVGPPRYKNSDFEIAFRYPKQWEVEERYGRTSSSESRNSAPSLKESEVRDEPVLGPEVAQDAEGRYIPAPEEPVELMSPGGEHKLPLRTDGTLGIVEDPDGAKLMIIVRGPAEESLSIVVFPKTEDLEAWISSNPDRIGNAIMSGDLDLTNNKAQVNGRNGYLWSRPASAQDGPGGGLLLDGDEYLYLVEFLTTNNDLGVIEEVIRSVVVGDRRGPTYLPLHMRSLESYTTQSASCSSCGETDAYSNNYSCCAPKGNCTWKCEERRSGANNFYFGGVSGRDAYKWMSLTEDKTTYAQGGTMPQVGAVLATIDDVGGVGHVATVTSINTNGAVTVAEQNCPTSSFPGTCTQSKTYATSWLLTNIAGYIYNSSSAPTPTAKSISASGETTIEDFTFSNTHNFSTYGPGCTMSFNNGYRAWGTSTSGSNGCMHYIRSRSGSYENYGRWRNTIQQTGLYEMQAFIPNSTLAGSTSIVYDINGTFSSAINQSTNRGRWVKLRNPGRVDGNWSLGTGTYNVYLADNYASTAGQWIAFDAIKFIRR